MSEKSWKQKIFLSCDPKSHDFFIVAKDVDKIIGMIGAFRAVSGIWNIHSVYVRACARGRGIATQLLYEIITSIHIRDRRAVIELTVNEMQVPAIRVYQKCGFVVCRDLGVQLSGDGKQYNKLRMRYHAHTLVMMHM